MDFRDAIEEMFEAELEERLHNELMIHTSRVGHLEDEIGKLELARQEFEEKALSLIEELLARVEAGGNPPDAYTMFRFRERAYALEEMQLEAAP